MKRLSRSLISVADSLLSCAAHNSMLNAGSHRGSQRLVLFADVLRLLDASLDVDATLRSEGVAPLPADSS